MEAEVAKIAQYQLQWTWEAIPHGQDAFLMSFPSEEVLHRVTRFVVFIKSHNVTIEFKPWKPEEIPHRLSSYLFRSMCMGCLTLSDISWGFGRLARSLVLLLMSIFSVYAGEDLFVSR